MKMDLDPHFWGGSVALLIALGIGLLLTVSLTVAARLYQAGAEAWTRILSWPNTLMQSFVPCNNIGTPDHPFCEGAPLNVLAYWTSHPFGIFVYSAVAYIFIRRWSSHGT